MAYSNNGGGGFNGGGSRPVAFAKGAASPNKKPKDARSRHFGGTLKFPDDTARWLNVWIAGEKGDPEADQKAQYIKAEMEKLGLYLSINVGDIAPAQQGGQQSNQGGGYSQQQGNFGGGYGGGQQQGGSGFSQGGFRR